MLEGHLLSERYQIKKTIGGGGMANVYLATDIILDRDVAVKVLRHEYVNDEEFIIRFDREAKAATSLSHPNIVNIFDVGEEKHILYMVMEYVDGMTLKEYIQKNGPIEVEDVLDIIGQVTSAIAHAHANDLVHRDIKPQNILIDSYGHVKVTDFGIAIALSATALTQTNAVLGSVHYLSPEQARGGTATKKSDIYSLGIVLFELLTGKLPFSGQTPVSIALKHLQSDIPPVKRYHPEIPQSVENIVLRATTKDPFHRYETADQLKEAIETALYPNKLNEAVYTPPIEAGEETKAIPVITDDHIHDATNQHTIVHQTNQTTKNYEKEEKNKQKPKKKKSKKKRIIFISIFVLIAAGILALFILPGLLQPKEVVVPDVVNEHYEDAIKELEEKKLIVKEEYIYSEDIEEDHVIKTNPKADKTVKEESVVTIFISQGKEKITFEDYVGQDYDRVKRLLTESGFTDIRSIDKHSDKPVGEIIAQIKPDVDSEVVPNDTSVVFEVSTGPELISLNNLTGMTEKEAKDYLDKKELVMNVHEENSEKVDEGHVIRQSPATSTELEKGSTVDVYISIGPEEKPPKPHTITFTVPYIQEETEGEENEDVDEDEEEKEEKEPTPQVVRIYIDDMNNNITEIFKEQEILEATEFTITLSIEPNKQAEYKVMRDDEVLENKQVSYEDGE